MSVDVVCLPAASKMLKVTGLTHVPFVMYSKNLRWSGPIELTSVTLVGAATVYGGFPP